MAPIPPTPPTTLLHKTRISQYVSLAPAALSAPLPALCASIFSPLLLSYFAPARGVVLAYSDVSLSSSRPPTESQSRTHPTGGAESDAHAQKENEVVLLRHIDEYTPPFLWATATLLILRPERNAHVRAHTTHASKTHITLSYLNVFAVSVLAAHLPSSWVFRERGDQAQDQGEGVWMDGDAVVQGELEVRVLDFEHRGEGRAGGRGGRIEGSLISVEEEERRREGGKGKGRAVKKGILKRGGGGVDGE